MGYRLGVDLGTTFTAAAVDDGTGPTMLGLGNRALTVPSVVFLSPEGTFLFGEAADRRAVGDPSRSAREFKRRIGDTVPILLAGQPFSPQALSAKLLAWTISVATERQGAAPDQVVVTYPANWGGYKRDLLQQVITLADAPTALTCTEPEAAATQYASRARLSAGEKVAVYDLGGGTFDVCVLEKHEDGFAILGSPDGVEHLGGIDFDEAVFQHVLGMLGDQVAGLDPSDPQVTDGLARLRRECVEAKEALSNDVETTVSVLLPGLTTSVRLTRAELDGLITSPLRDTLDAMQRALRSAHLAAADLATIVLVGGSSRIPLVSHLLQSEFGVHTALDTHPKHDIALGAVQYHPTEASVPAPAAAPSVIRWPTRGRKQTSQTPTPAPTPVEPEDEPATQPLPVAREEPKAEPRSGPPTWTPPTGADTGPKPSPEPTESWFQRHLTGRRPLLIGLGAAVAVAAVAGSAYALSRSSGGQTADTAGQTPATSGQTTRGQTPAPRVVGKDSILIPVVESGDPTLHRISMGNGSDLGHVPGLTQGSQLLASQSRDGSHIVYGWAPPGSGTPENGGTLKVTDGKRSVDLFTRPPEGVECWNRVGWSPDGTEMVLLCHPKGRSAQARRSDQNAVYTAALDADGRIDGGALHRQFGPQEAQAAGSRIGGIGFAHDGRIVADFLGGDTRGLYVAEPGGVPQQLTSGHDLDASTSPTDDLVAFSREGDIYVASLNDTPPPCPSSGERSQDETGTSLCDLTPSNGTAQDPSWSWDGTRIAYRTVDKSGLGPLHLIRLGSGTSRQLSGTTYQFADSWASR